MSDKSEDALRVDSDCFVILTRQASSKPIKIHPTMQLFINKEGGILYISNIYTMIEDIFEEKVL